MAESTLDLWPEDIVVADAITPLGILKEQASLLGEKTQNLVEAEVRTSASDAGFYHSFFLVAPALDNYQYKLFVVSQPVDIYPLTIRVTDASGAYEINSEVEFIAKLREVLTSEKTKSIIKALIAQSQS